MLTQSDKHLIAAIVTTSDFPDRVTACQVVTIRTDNGVVWVRLTECWVAFDYDWFKEQVAIQKTAGATRLTPRCAIAA